MWYSDCDWRLESLVDCEVSPDTNLPTKVQAQYSVPSVSTLQLLLDKYIINVTMTDTSPEKLLEKGVCDYVNTGFDRGSNDYYYYYYDDDDDDDDDYDQETDPSDQMTRHPLSLAPSCVKSLLQGLYLPTTSCLFNNWRDMSYCNLRPANTSLSENNCEGGADEQMRDWENCDGPSLPPSAPSLPSRHLNLPSFLHCRRCGVVYRYG